MGPDTGSTQLHRDDACPEDSAPKTLTIRRRFLVTAAATTRVVVDLVWCGDRFEARAATLMTVWDQDTFYFCSSLYQRRSERDPGTFWGTIAASLPQRRSSWNR